MELVDNTEEFYKRNFAKVDTAIWTEIYHLLSSFAIMFCSCN
jgi:hypothetical protein